MGFYIGPSMNHFRNYYCYIPTTRGYRVSNTVEFFPTHVKMQQTSLEDRLTQVTQYLLIILTNPHPRTPFLYQGGKTSDFIKKSKAYYNHPNENIPVKIITSKGDSGCQPSSKGATIRRSKAEISKGV